MIIATFAGVIRKLIWAERQKRKHVSSVKLFLLEIFSHTQQKLRKAIVTLLPSSTTSTPRTSLTRFSNTQALPHSLPLGRPQLVFPEGSSHYLNGRFALQAVLMWGFADITPGLSLVSSENSNQLADQKRAFQENINSSVWGSHGKSKFIYVLAIQRKI